MGEIEWIFNIDVQGDENKMPIIGCFKYDSDIKKYIFDKLEISDFVRWNYYYI